MSQLPRHARQLEKELLALGEDAMLLDELDGFIAGLLTCPELIMPSDWLPHIWHEDSADQTPVFRNRDHADRVFGLVKEYYNGVAQTLMEHPERYGPLFTVDTRNEDVVWEIWMGGFEKAVALRPAAWRQLLEADDETAAALSGLLLLAEIARGDKEVEFDDPVMTAAPDKIADWVVVLNEWRLANYQPLQDLGPPASPGQKVGRNEPCPCGSGKKYKRCCGLN